MSLTMLTVNNAGDAAENPVVAGLALRIRLSKHDAADVLRRCWIAVGGVLHADLTAACVETEDAVTVDVTAGTELHAGSTPVLNVIHFTTDSGKHAKAGLYVASQPAHSVLLDGYDGSNAAEPLIVPWYVSA